MMIIHPVNVKKRIRRFGLWNGKIRILQINGKSYSANTIITSVAQFDHLRTSLTQDKTIKTFEFIME